MNNQKALPQQTQERSHAATALTVIRVETRSRVIKPVKGGHVRGYQPLGAGRPSVAFESLLEKRAIRELAKFPELKSLVAQPVSVVYRIGGKERRYTPDFLVELSEVPPELETLGFGVRTLLEIKAAGLLAMDRERLELGVKALRAARQPPFVLLTDADLEAGALEVRHG